MEKVGPEYFRYHIVQSRMIIERTRIIYQQVIYYLPSLYTDYLRTLHGASFFFWTKIERGMDLVSGSLWRLFSPLSNAGLLSVCHDAPAGFFLLLMEGLCIHRNQAKSLNPPQVILKWYTNKLF